MSRATAKKPKGPFDPTLERVGRGERVVLRRGKKAVAAVVPLKDLRLLEEIEDRLDAELARKALAEPGRMEYREFFRSLVHRRTPARARSFRSWPPTRKARGTSSAA